MTPAAILVYHEYMKTSSTLTSTRWRPACKPDKTRQNPTAAKKYGVQA
jgi:hypothetical protein